MANPHPTKSKPNKIGRKHTQGERLHQRARREKGVLIMKKKFEAQRRKMMQKIKQYWDGEIDIFPSM